MAPILIGAFDITLSMDRNTPPNGPGTYTVTHK